MKPGPKCSINAARLLVFGAHPDDIEFGCGGVVALETQAGAAAHFVVCSKGEAATNGTPKQRTVEAIKAADILGASLQWLPLDGDAKLELKASHAMRLARIIREQRPDFILAPSLAQNQHPDHWRLGMLVRDAARIARFGGVKELRKWPAHRIAQLYFYAVTSEAEPSDISPILFDISAPPVFAAWVAAMEAHQSQVSARDYVGLQVARAQLNGRRAGVSHATALYPNDPPLTKSLAPLGAGARQF